MKITLPEIRPEERTPLVEALLAIIASLMDRVAELERGHQEFRDEIASLKGQKARPDIKPSTLEKPEKPATDATGEGRKRGKPSGPRNDKLVIHETVELEPPDLPAGAQFHQFESYIVQDLIFESRNTEYKRGHSSLIPTVRS